MDTKEEGRCSRRREIKANIQVNPKNKRKSKHGKGYRLNKETYRRMRSSVERLSAWLTGGFRRLALRWERLTSTFPGFIQLAIIIYWRGIQFVC
ncbi:MAG: hypothetical protein DRJ37_02685 [Thermoprotei archaeon]|nr:MAG: hypothetical protein DRJ37_02685 [Thermoprotei archaeon]